MINTELKVNLLCLDLDQAVRKGRINNHPSLDNQLVYPLALEQIKTAKSIGYAIVGCSNQEGIEKGYKSLEDCKKEIEQLDLLALELFDAILFCPDLEGRLCYAYEPRKPFYGGWDDVEDDNETFEHESDESETWFLFEALTDLQRFRKPDFGMINIARNYCDVTFAEKIYFVGNKPEDKECASNANIGFIDAEVWRIEGIS